MIEAIKDPSRELAFTARALIGDSKNYHAWAHRQWVLETFKLWENELTYTDELIKVRHLDRRTQRADTDDDPL